MKKACDPEALSGLITMSHRALARAALCSKNTPGRLLAGKAVEDNAAVRIARVLGRPLGELFEDTVSSTEQDISKHGAAA